MRLKSDVSVKKLSPQILLAIMIARDMYATYHKNLVVTSISEGIRGDKIHSDLSYHYDGYAVDLRTNYFTPTQVSGVVDDLREALTNEYDVVFEGNHIHIEFNARTV